MLPTPTRTWNEEDRLRAIASYDILDTPKEEDFEDIVQMAAQACEAPVCLISFVTTGRQWFKAAVGTDLSETPLSLSICSHAILQRELFMIPDTTLDPRTRDNPLVAGEPHLRFYAGALLEASDGLPLGTLCILDYKPRQLTEQQATTLKALARQVMAQLELRRALSALRRANHLLNDKTALLENVVQLRTRKLSETVGELEAFSYSISHDLRAPLRAMIGFSEMLKEDYGGSLDETGIDYLNRISAASRRMDQLIEDVLVFSRLSREEVSLKPVDTDMLVRELIQTYPNFRSEIVDISIEGSLPAVRGNESLLTQCFSNLLENGVKFVAAGTKPRIQVRGAINAGRARICFQDNGIGIPANQLERIFGIFQRVGRDYKGTGIGLSIVRKAAEKMGGSSSVESELGKGSLFWLDLQPA